MRDYTNTIQTAITNKVFLQKVHYVLSFSCLNLLRYLHVLERICSQTQVCQLRCI